MMQLCNDNIGRTRKTLTSLMVVFCLLVSSASFAEGGGGESCKNCGKGGEEGGGGGGGQAGEILMGIAAIIAPIAAAAAQVAAAKEKANADKYIAKVSSDAAITQTEIQSDTTKQLAENQKLVAEKNTEATKQLAKDQQESSTQRLEMQLAALEKEREKAADERSEIRAIEEKRVQEQVALAQEQADKQLKLAKQAIYLQTAQNSLVPSSSSGNGLATTTLGGSRGDVSGGQQSTNPLLGANQGTQLGVTNRDNYSTAIAGPIPGGATNVPIVRGVASAGTPLNTTATAAPRTLNLAINQNKPAPAAVSAAATTSLLASVRSDFSRNFGGSIGPQVKGGFTKFATARMRGVNQSALMASSSTRALDAVLRSNRGVIGGSTRGVRQKINDSRNPNSGLRAFAQAIDSQYRPHAGGQAKGSGSGAHGGRVGDGRGSVTSYSLRGTGRGVAR